MAKLWKRNKGMDKGTSEIHEIIYVHRFTGGVSVHFLHTFILGKCHFLPGGGGGLLEIFQVLEIFSDPPTV